MRNRGDLSAAFERYDAYAVKTRGHTLSVDEPAKAIRPSDPLIWLVPLVLNGLGILMVTSTTSPMSFEASGTPFTLGLRQLQWMKIGFCAMIAAYCVPTRFWYKTAGFIWFVSVVLVVLAAIPGVGYVVGGARRWLRFAGVSVQPSEILTLATVFLFARLAAKNEFDATVCFQMMIALIIASSAPLMLQPDFGSTILVFIICMGMYVERFGWKLPLLAGGIGSVLLSCFIFFEPYRMRRINAFLNPWLDPLNSGFQTIQGLIAFANGGAWGSGLGHGFQKLNYLPAAYTDFIYAALGEELGLVGTLGILALCLMWIARCRVLYNIAPEGFETSIVWGITITIIAPCCINIAGVTNLLPLTGMPLPFISYGGSSLVMMWLRIGVLLRIHREARDMRSL